MKKVFKKILFTTPVLEHPPAGGPQLRIENSIIALSRVSELHVLSRVDKGRLGGEKADQFFRGYCREFVYLPSINSLSANRYIRKVQRIIKKTISDNDADFIIDYAKKRTIDFLWFGYGNISYPLIKEIKKKCPSLKLVCDTDSVWSRFILRELPYENETARRMEIERKGKHKKLEEEKWVNLCDVTTAVSEVDVEYYRKIAREPEKVRLFSNAINIKKYVETVSPPENYQKPCFHTAGSFWPKSPMEKSTRWVLNEVLPKVKMKIPDIHFYIVGRGSKETFCDIKDPCVTITGKLPSVFPYLSNADVSIIPLMFESGTRFKILEAGACDVPIVSTTLGAEGIPLEDGKNIILADDPESFAEGIIKLIQDKFFAAQIAGNCKKLIHKKYGIDSLGKEAVNIISYLSQ